MTVRPAAVAGSFYPANPRVLSGLVDELLAEGAATAPARLLKAVIVPHAGYVYSGAIAARAYRLLRTETARLSRVVVIGPAHFVTLAGMAAPRSDAFETPLGKVPVDRRGLEALNGLGSVVIDDQPHRPEHAIEVQLPFLQRVLDEFKVAPLVVGDAQGDEVSEALSRLWGGADTLLVMSSDLSHYHDYETAKRLDEATATAIENYQLERLRPEHACGFLPIAGLLGEARQRGLLIERLDLENSGDTAGPRDRVVGYGAWALYESDATSGAERRA